MNEKISIQELTEQFAESKGIQKKDAENYIKEFFKLIEKALNDERYVKIKGFGTFKLIEVDSRESINVNTGERIEIQGHTKITFTPDASLKDLVNKPFAHFESVVLNEGAFIDGLPTDEDDTEEENPAIEEESTSRDAIHCIREEIPAIDEEPIIEEETPAIEEEPSDSRDVACSVREEEPTSEEETPTIDEESIVEEETPAIEEELSESRDVACSVREEEPTSEEETPAIEEEPTIEEELTAIPLLQEGGVPSGGVVGSDTEDIEEQPTSEEQPQPEEAPEMDNQMAQIITNIENELETNKKPKSMIGNLRDNIAKDFKEDTQGMKYFFGIVAFIILLCIAAIVFLYHPTLLTDLMPKPQEQGEVTQEATPEEVIPADTLAIQTDTLAVQTDTVVAQPDTVVAPVVELPQPTSPPVVEEKPQPAPQPATSYKASGVYTITGTQTEHTVKRGETLRIISEKYFGTRELSTYIVEHNKDIISNPNNVAVGTKIKIPKLEKK
ncbi:MAG: HU family DNA-binding protein [Bacteroides sp.]|nr:HU family DNA-binding protein [Bacteroides sp.]